MYFFFITIYKAVYLHIQTAVSGNHSESDTCSYEISHNDRYYHLQE